MSTSVPISASGRNRPLQPTGNHTVRKARLAILLSGRGSNMVALVKAVHGGVLRELAEVAVVFSNKPDAPGLETAAALGCVTASLTSQGRKRQEFDAEVVDILTSYQPDYIVLAGYMRILSPTFIRAFAGRILNIHPADTHQHQGLHAYEWAFEKQLEETKITVHLVDEGLDTGPVLAQHPVDLQGADTLAEVERRGLAVEHFLYADTLARLIRGELPSPTPEPAAASAAVSQSSSEPLVPLSSGSASPAGEALGGEASR
ncbi:phosphoribosylglycinamide formyltransferase [Hymenobacter chitinivorans]|uniref:Phosphoribosylglycinamide formyltransferase n=1 Tax=Hymenobacter chitinivorans DSM 11115 TaxID=1121954 RepID=A0A2M9B5V8_9BACT|nr:phosphoribosylglycinamide formyltransferase [Hymenobacter chitinivorans]PJJ53331.1 phosphoribosylglycinamide formyltransferase-1 [Hymenobacter chitinivorans DSM 11115]